jgi:hypothetical protein
MAPRPSNDDGDLLHHAYLTSPTFSFDSNDQKPGTSFTVVFPVEAALPCGAEFIRK